MSETNRGQQWLLTLLKHCGLVVEVSTAQPEVTLDKLKRFGGVWLTVSSEQLSSQQVEALVGQSGTVLDSIQYLLNSTLNLGQSQDAQEAYTVELDDFRAKRYLGLADLAFQVADELRQTGGEHQTSGEHEMPRLSSAERRLVHTILYDVEDLETLSRGEGIDRRLVIRYIPASASP